LVRPVDIPDERRDGSGPTAGQVIFASGGLPVII